jgi:hypothetical protein
MFKYRKKPVVIEAFEFRSEPNDQTSDYPNWFMEALRKQPGEPGAIYMAPDSDEWRVNTLEGFHVISDGDYIIQGIKGELYPCKPDIFEATYEAVTE